jgi:hypothetical protein
MLHTIYKLYSALMLAVSRSLKQLLWVGGGVTESVEMGMGLMTMVQFLEGAMMGFFSLCLSVQTSSGAHPALYTKGTGA